MMQYVSAGDAIMSQFSKKKYEYSAPSGRKKYYNRCKR